MTQRKKQIFLIVAIFCFVILVDQMSKALIWAKFPTEHGPVFSPDHPVFFQLTHQRNPGLVGGIFLDRPIMAKIAPLLATLVLLYLFWHIEVTSKIQNLAYGLIAGGAVGNLIDRIRFGSVTDFLQFHFYFVPFEFPWKRYPAFNAADTAICTGVFLLMVSWWFTSPPREASSPPETKPEKNAA